MFIPKNTAQSIDFYSLYTAAFQDPEREMPLLRDEYTQQFGNPPQRLREDFCGTCANGFEWIKLGDQYRAIGIDVDETTIKLAQAKRDSLLLTQEKDRITLIHGDVLDLQLPTGDVVAALNCSFCYFWERHQFKEYLEKCFATISNCGMIALEIYCGADAYNLGCDEIAIEGATAIWEQAKFDPVTNRCLNFIHFRLSDGELIERVFEYDFRLWSPAECIDLLYEVGFSQIKTVNLNEIHADEPQQVDSSATLFILGFKHD